MTPPARTPHSRARFFSLLAAASFWFLLLVALVHQTLFALWLAAHPHHDDGVWGRRAMIYFALATLALVVQVVLIVCAIRSARRRRA